MNRLSPTVRLLGAVSFLNDVASEMISPVLPIFLTTQLGAGPAAVGLIEGAAEAASSLLKYVSGRVSDRTRLTRSLVTGGYTLSNLVRPLVALAGTWPVVLVLRFTDRVGKGVRTAPRDALITRTTEPTMRGRAFGFHRAMDHLGATVGPLVAFGLLSMGLDMKTLFLWSAVPGGLLILLLVWKLGSDASATAEPVKARADEATGAPGAWKGLVAAAMLQAFALVPDAFLVLWASERGFPTVSIPLVWAAAHLVRSPIVRLVGGWSDAGRRRTVIAVGWLARVGGLAGLAFAPAGAVWTVGFFLLWAGLTASTESAERALVADLSAARTHGAAFGVYHMGIGLAALPGALVFGTVWQAFGRTSAFGLSALVTSAAAVILIVSSSKIFRRSEA